METAEHQRKRGWQGCAELRIDHPLVESVALYFAQSSALARQDLAADPDAFTIIEFALDLLDEVAREKERHRDPHGPAALITAKLAIMRHILALSEEDWETLQINGRGEFRIKQALENALGKRHAKVQHTSC